MSDQSILWRRLDRPGHEAARTYFQDDSWYLAGTAVLAQDGEPCRLDYLVVCDVRWQTRSARVEGWAGDRLIDIRLEVDGACRWHLNGAEYDEVAGCTDVDFGFSPSTNLLPIRRLHLAIGQAAEVRAAWLRFPGFNVELLEQVYRRTGEASYRYESNGGRFVADLEVNRAGLVTHYPNLWEVEPGG